MFEIPLNSKDKSSCNNQILLQFAEDRGMLEPLYFPLGRKKAVLPCNIRVTFCGHDPAPFALHTSLPFSKEHALCPDLTFAHSANFCWAPTACQEPCWPGTCRGRGSRPCLQGPITFIIIHPTTGRKQQQESPSGILLWVVDRKECFMSGFQRVDSCPHQNSTHGPGMQISQSVGWGGAPGGRPDRKLKA